MTICATAPAKLVMLGEYAVLEGAPAIVAALDRAVEVTLDEPTGESWRFSSDLPGYAVSHVTWNDEGVAVATEEGEHDDWTVLPGTVVECVAEAAGIDPRRIPPADVRIQSRALHVEDGRMKLGLGSSAAVIVAFAAALRKHLQAHGLLTEVPAPEDALLEDLWINAEVQQGRGSGVDVAAATFGGLLAYQVAEDALSVEPVTLPEDIRFAVIWTGVPASTARFLEGMEAFEERDPESYARHTAALAALAARGLEACRAGDGADWLGAVRAWMPALRDLGDAAGLPITAGPHEAIAALAEGGETAYKPSGAGGGDVGLLFARSADALAQTRRRIEDAGYVCVDLRVHPQGVHVDRPGPPTSLAR